MEKENENFEKIKKWIFAEWISIIGTFVICFVFLFYQNQVQSARSDRLYEMWCETQKEVSQKFYETQQEIKQLYKERKQV